MGIRDIIQRIYDSPSVRMRRNPTGADLPTLTPEFRNRVIMLWRDLINPDPTGNPWSLQDHSLVEFWQEMHNALTHLYGRPHLSEDRHFVSAWQDLTDFLIRCDTDQFFDFMEVAFKLPISRRLHHHSADILGAIDEIFLVTQVPCAMTRLVTTEHPRRDSRGVGAILVTSYPQVVLVDEQIPHEEAVQPALTALGAAHFTNANEEFLKALRHHRKGEYSDCLAACSTAIESVMKILCDRNQLHYRQSDAYSTLLNSLFPKTSLQPFFREMLMHIGTLRNKMSSAHGAGTQQRDVPRHLSQYCLTQTASAIVLLVEEVGP